MTKTDRHTRSYGELNVNTSDIVYLQIKETEIYRHIFLFLYPKVKSWILQDQNAKKTTGFTFFKVREVVNYLLDYHSEFKKKYEGSKVRKAYRAHTNTPLVLKRLERLVDLELLEKSDVKVKSLRNDTLITDLYDVTPRGKMVTLTIGLQDPKNFIPHSQEDNRILSFLLEEWLDLLPNGYRSIDNYYYHFLVDLMKGCIGKYRNTVISFINLFQEYDHGYDINFSDLRAKTNFILYCRLTKDSEFKTLFFKTLSDHNVLHLMGSEFQLAESQARQFMHPKIRLIKRQFKLDVENMFEVKCSDYLKHDSSNIREYQWQIKNKKMNTTNEEISKDELVDSVCKEVILDFNIKNQWEEERYKNLSDFVKITTLIKCSHCNHVYSMAIEIENALLSDIICKHCNNKDVIALYDFENETNSQYHKRLLSRFPWMSKDNDRN
ncbi:MAG TPA: hypothetical protein VFG45_03450 [Candidatus Nitrosocosmicus sp.]|nr:hypothetical protein [Candidatus Nitrosocosmicus sp.]